MTIRPILNAITAATITLCLLSTNAHHQNLQLCVVCDIMKFSDVSRFPEVVDQHYSPVKKCQFDTVLMIYSLALSSASPCSRPLQHWIAFKEAIRGHCTVSSNQYWPIEPPWSCLICHHRGQARGNSTNSSPTSHCRFHLNPSVHMHITQRKHI